MMIVKKISEVGLDHQLVYRWDTRKYFREIFFFSGYEYVEKLKKSWKDEEVYDNCTMYLLLFSDN